MFVSSVKEVVFVVGAVVSLAGVSPISIPTVEDTGSVALLLRELSDITETILILFEGTHLSPGQIQTPEQKATINALITSLSPLKSPGSSPYFQGEVSDGQTVIPLVGFETLQRQQLEELLHKQQLLTLCNCQISFNDRTQKLQIVIKTHTSIEKASVDFSVEDPKTLGSPLVTLDQIHHYNEYDRVTV